MQNVVRSCGEERDVDKILPSSEVTTMTSDAAEADNDAVTDIIPHPIRHAVTRFLIVLPCLSVNLSTPDAIPERDPLLPGECACVTGRLSPLLPFLLLLPAPLYFPIVWLVR